MNIISFFSKLFDTIYKKKKGKGRILFQGKSIWEEKVKKLEYDIREVFVSSGEFHMEKKLADVNQLFNTIHSHHLNHTYTITIEIKRKGDEDALIYVNLSKAKIDNNRIHFVGSLKRIRFSIEQHNEIIKAVDSYKKEVLLKETFNKKNHRSRIEDII